MEWINFLSIIKYMVDTYGVPYGFGDKEHEYEFPSNEEECQSAWFECPECCEPILFVDWVDALTAAEVIMEDCFICPICEYEFREENDDR